MTRHYIIGAGIAGLSAGLTLVHAGCQVTLLEASPYAGGRCRSFTDRILGQEIDNGTHLLLQANSTALKLIKQLGTEQTLIQLDGLPMQNLQTGVHFHLQRLFGIPGLTKTDILAILKLLWTGKTSTVAECLRHAPLYDTLWQPMAVSILNTPAETASARLFGRVIRHLLRHLFTMFRAYLPTHHWQETLIHPSVETLEKAGAKLRFRARAKSLTQSDGRITHIELNNEILALGPEDRVILATPPHITHSLLPELPIPTEAHAIVNAHFVANHSITEPLIGLTGGNIDWLRLRPGIISTTTSAADHLGLEDDTVIAAKFWREIRQAIPNLPTKIPQYRIIRERRATFAATPASLTLRPKTRTLLPNLFLAGDYIDTNLPATIESAVRSGQTAARLACS